MKIYTKRGDKGETGLYGGARVPKDDLRIRTYGTIDEFNALLGLILSNSDISDQVRKTLLRIQSELFQLGAELATPRGKSPGIQLIEEVQIKTLENEIDSMETQLKPLQTFILPGGSQPAALCHLARTVCRRAERELITLHRSEPLRPIILEYLNRLSDHLFVTSRYLNHQTGVQDVPWIAPCSEKK